jgi:hypothetical protein
MPNPVDCIWTKPDEISITLPQKQGKEDYSFDSGADVPDFADIRISPKGLLYHQGKEITLEHGFEIVRTAKKPKGAPTDEWPIIQITQPPPFRSFYDEELAYNKITSDLFTALVKYGESVNVHVQPIW